MNVVRKIWPVVLFFVFLLNSDHKLAYSDPGNTNEARFRRGEKITFAITKMGIKTGEATLVFEGAAQLEGRATTLIVFTARAFNFLDEEKIYVDPETFYPLIVKRKLNIWGKKENIIEDYTESPGVVKITKIAGGKTTEQRIEKKSQLDNIYCFIYRYRQKGNFKLGDHLNINLPTKELSIKLEKMTYIKVADQVFDAFYMKSDPPQYQLWFDSGPKKLPLKVNGAIGFGDMSMTMIAYKG